MSALFRSPCKVKELTEYIRYNICHPVNSEDYFRIKRTARILVKGPIDCHKGTAPERI